MNCHEARQHLMLYLDSEGDPELHFRISDHLGMCPACAEWFTKQQRFEQALTERLAQGEATPDLWQRVLAGAGLTPAPVTSHRRWLLFGGALAAALLVLAFGLHALLAPRSSELGLAAAQRHHRWLHGEDQPELVSASDREVEEHLRKRVSFPVHCPPRGDVKFAVGGAGVCRIRDREAAHIVGRVEQMPVSIFVLAAKSVEAFPNDRHHLAQGGGRHRCREGSYQMVSGLIRDNLVVVIGSAPPEALEQLLAAYGSYH
ncbi:MAG: zf-HC2 domain-containing protein [Gemmataceae bacterium]|nr:zf-HC2 domain-containing protein [Gemmataceae bacterium]